MLSLRSLRIKMLLDYAVILAFSLCALCLAIRSDAQSAPTYNNGWMRLGSNYNTYYSDYVVTQPVWSPDGTRVALTHGHNVKVVNALTGLLEWIYHCRGTITEHSSCRIPL